MRRLLSLGAVALIVTGCTGALGSNVAGMSPDQLKQWVRITDASCSKITGIYMGATFSAISVSVDKGIPPGNFGGTVKIDDTCGTTITVSPKP